jgi:hypothetical protein
MTALRYLAVMVLAALLPGCEALAQATANEATWSFSVSAYAFILPGHDDYLQPTLTADHDWLHLEARYNYEALETGSIWAGYNFGVGETVTFEGTAMVGAAFGATDGIAPGYKASLSWTKLTFYSEGEYLFDSNGSADSFLYAWSELTWAPVDWCRLGLVGQRTKAYETERDIQRGILVGFSSERVDFTTYAFNLDERQPTVVMALGVSF